MKLQFYRGLDQYQNDTISINSAQNKLMKNLTKNI